MSNLSKAGEPLEKIVPNRILVSENFYVDELVDPSTYLLSEDNGRSKVPNILPCLQLLRTKKGSSISVNNWWATYVKMLLEGYGTFEIIEYIESNSKNHDGKNLHKWSGYRPPHCTIGAKASAHRLSKAVDPKGNQYDLAKIVVDNAAEFYELGLRRLENPKITNGWLHMDTEARNAKSGYIRVINLNSHAYDIEAK